MIVTQLAQVALQVTDVLMTGRLGPIPLAAGALGMQLTMVLLIFGVGLLLAVPPLVAQARGARDAVSVRHWVWQGVWVSIVISVVIVALLSLSGRFFALIDQPVAIGEMAARYVTALLFGIPAILAFVALRGALGALSRPGLATVVTFLAVPINAALNWVLMYGNLGAPALGLLGAGVTTAIVQWGMLISLLILARRDVRLGDWMGRGPRGRGGFTATGYWRPDLKRMGAIAGMGAPVAAMLGLEFGALSVSTWLMGWLGEVAAAANAIALQLASITLMVPLGIAAASVVRVGIAHGARHSVEARHAAIAALMLGVGATTVMALVLWQFGAPIARLFVGPSASVLDRMVIAEAAGLLAVVAGFQILNGWQTIATHALRGMGDVVWPLMVMALAYWPIAFALAPRFSFDLGFMAQGVWMGLATGIAIVAVLLTLRLMRRTRPLR